MRPFEASIQTVVIRFFLMMAIVIIGGFIGQYWLMAFALPIFLITILGVSFTPETQKVTTLASQLKPNQRTQQAA